MRNLFIICIVFYSAICTAQEAAQPGITKLSVIPIEVTQCRPVRVTITLTNRTDTTISSQRPYAGATYSLYRTFYDMGFQTQPDRYMVGISLNSGLDGYPYRWGFRSPIQPGRAVDIAGFLLLLEPGSYGFTGAVFRGDTLMAGSEFPATPVIVNECRPAPITGAPTPMRPAYFLINGRRLPRFTPYAVGGHMLIPLRPFAANIGAEINVLADSVVVRRSGIELVLFPGGQRVILNGISIILPVPVYRIGGVTYVPLRYVSPFLGSTFYWYPYNSVLFIDDPISAREDITPQSATSPPPVQPPAPPSTPQQ